MFDEARRFFFVLVGGSILVGGAYLLRFDGWIGATAMLFGFVISGWQIADSLWDRHNTELIHRSDLTRQRKDFVISIASADSEARSFLSMEWPELGVMDVEIKPSVYILNHGMNTNILLECFQRFLQDSDEREFADVRRYNEDKTLQELMGMSRQAIRVQWDLSTRHLVKKGFIYPNSAQGSHSFLWVSKDHYFRMVQWYITGTASLPEIGSEAA
jgi:hypothetical protein